MADASAAASSLSDSRRATAGATVIAEGVIATIAGIAAQGVPGVYGVGGGLARALGTVREAIGQTDRGQGVTVEITGRQVAVGIALIAEYPTPMRRIADGVRTAVYTAIETLAGMEVVGVSVTITEMHIPDDDDDDEADSVAA